MTNRIITQDLIDAVMDLKEDDNEYEVILKLYCTYHASLRFLDPDVRAKMMSSSLSKHGYNISSEEVYKYMEMIHPKKKKHKHYEYDY